MKNIKAFILVAVSAVALALASNASAQDAKQGIVTVVRIQGQARYSSGDNVWHSLTAGKTLGAGDVIQTGADSMVDIVLSDKAVQVGMQMNSGSPIGGMVNVAGLPLTPLTAKSAPQQNVLRLQPDTVLAVDKFSYTQTGVDTVSDTELDLRAGKIFGNVKKISAASQYIVKTPTGVAGIRGTTFYLGADGTVTCTDGEVVFSFVGANNQTITVTIPAGSSFKTQSYNAANPQSSVTALGSDALSQAQENATTVVNTVDASVSSVSVTATVTTGNTTTIHVSPNAGISVAANHS